METHTPHTPHTPHTQYFMSIIFHSTELSWAEQKRIHRPKPVCVGCKRDSSSFELSSSLQPTYTQPNNIHNFQRWMSRFPQRWRTQRNAIRNANCYTSWIIKTLNAHCALRFISREHACLSICVPPSALSVCDFLYRAHLAAGPVLERFYCNDIQCHTYAAYFDEIKAHEWLCMCIHTHPQTFAARACTDCDTWVILYMWLTVTRRDGLSTISLTWHLYSRNTRLPTAVYAWICTCIYFKPLLHVHILYVYER